MEFKFTNEAYIKKLETEIEELGCVIAESDRRSFEIFMRKENTINIFVKSRLNDLFTDEVAFQEDMKKKRERLSNYLEEAKKNQELFDKFD